MRFSYSQLNVSVDFSENKVFVWTIENPELFLEVTSDLFAQNEYGKESFYFSEDNEEIKFLGNTDIIWNPLLLDFNNRKFHNKLVAELKSISQDSFLNEFNETRLKICQYAEHLMAALPYEFKYHDGFDETAVFKAIDIKLQDEYETNLDKLLSYITLSQQLMSLKVLFAINLRDYFSKEQLSEIYKTCFYNKIYLVILEANSHPILPGEKGIIIDRDNCLIEY